MVEQIREGYYPEQIRNQALKETTPELKGLQLEVYELIKNLEPVTTEEIAERLNRRISSITARVFELREMKYVKFFGKTRSDTTGKMVSSWQITSKQLQLF